MTESQVENPNSGGWSTCVFALLTSSFLSSEMDCTHQCPPSCLLWKGSNALHMNFHSLKAQLAPSEELSFLSWFLFKERKVRMKKETKQRQNWFSRWDPATIIFFYHRIGRIVLGNQGAQVDEGAVTRQISIYVSKLTVNKPRDWTKSPDQRSRRESSPCDT